MQAVPAHARAPVLAPPIRSRAALRRLPDERLARWAARGSEAAFAVIFERHHQALHRYCHSIVGNGHDASDALQSTMLKAYRALDGETREITLKPWLYRIAHNESISLLRARHPDCDLDAAAHVGDPATEGLIESRDRLRVLAADLAELTEQGRGALLMRELGGLEFAEIGAALGISAAAAKQSVYESRCVLQALQEGRDMDCEVVRRTLSDGDRRALRGKKLRGHLRSCAGCQDFERALHERPAHLAALAPPLPMAAAAAMLSGLLGGGGAAGGFGAGGGLIASLTGGAKGIAGASLAAKVATVAVVGTAMVGGGALVVAPERGDRAPSASAGASAGATRQAGAPGATSLGSITAAPRMSPAHATTSGGEAALLRAAAAQAEPRPGEGPGAAARRGASQTAPGQTKAPGTSATGRGRGGQPAATAAARRAERAAARGHSGRPQGKPASPAAADAAALARDRAEAKALAKAAARARAKALAQRAQAGAPTAAGPSMTGPGAATERSRSPR
jgi:RNA polymerase sigma factor (sigma-70 family)